MMQTMYIRRKMESSITAALAGNPVTAVVGPRQCGKSTLVKRLVEKRKNCVCLDLERPSDLAKLENAEWFFKSRRDALFCIDEIQRRPELFPLLRSLADEWGRNGAFLVLGSASRDLLRQSSESLAGRISYKRLTPFLLDEINGVAGLEDYFARGGFPRSLLAPTAGASLEWREDFISTFLERDLAQWRGFSPATMRRLWRMLAHNNGQTVDYTCLGNALDLSGPTVRNHIDLLQSAFMLEVVPPWFSNLGKRLVKSPKVYMADSGITAALLGLGSFGEMSGHPSFGAVWEQIVLSNLRGLYPNAEFFFYRTAAGAEMDFIMRAAGKVLAFECKASLSPSVAKGFHHAVADIQPSRSFIVCPLERGKGWELSEHAEVVPLAGISKRIDKALGGAGA